MLKRVQSLEENLKKANYLKKSFSKTYRDLEKQYQKLVASLNEDEYRLLMAQRSSVRSNMRPLTTNFKEAVQELCFRLQSFLKDTVGDIHDEWQYDVAEADAEAHASLAVQAIKEAGEELNMLIPMDGKSKIGLNWACTH